MITVSALICTSMLQVGGVCATLEQVSSLSEKIYSQVSGEHWYTLSVTGKSLGTRSVVYGRLDDGRYTTTSETRYKINPAHETQLREVLTFDAESPHKLQSITTSTVRGDSSVTETIDATPFLQSQKNAATYLHSFPFHPLLNLSPNGHAQHQIDVGLHRVRSLPTQFVATLIPTVRREFDWTEPQSWTNLAKDGLPAEWHTHQGLSFRRTSKQQALHSLPTGSGFSNSPIAIPSTSRIFKPRNVTQLVVQLHGSEGELQEWQVATNTQSQIAVDHVDFALSNRDHEHHSSSRDEALTATVSSLLASANLTSAKPEQALEELVTFVNDLLTYEAQPRVSNLATTLERRTGDCTEYADVFDAMATQLGWQTRVRDGLVYDETVHKFSFHSWNEVSSNGRWIPVDATWNQTPADATHIPLPSHSLLRLLASSETIRISVVDTSYMSSNSILSF